MKALCFLHYRYANSENIVFSEKELAEQLIGVNRRILHYALEDLRLDDMVEREPIDEFGEMVDGFAISRKGIDLVEGWPDERYEEVATDIDFLESDSSFSGDIWSKPDTSQEISRNSIDEIKSHLGECIKVIAGSDFTQSEKSQILGLLRICEDLIELPTPKISLIKQVLSWLRDIAAIKELVEQILDHLDL